MATKKDGLKADAANRAGDLDPDERHNLLVKISERCRELRGRVDRVTFAREVHHRVNANYDTVKHIETVTCDVVWDRGRPAPRDVAEAGPFTATMPALIPLVPDNVRPIKQ